MSAEVQINTKEFEMELAVWLNENALEIAKNVARDARGKVKVKTGNLRKSIRAKKSKFEGGGAIVVASAPHAHLVEYGHKGAPAKPFLRPALDQTMAEARAIFGAQ